MKFLITGITGFVGPHLAKLLLNKGHEVVGLYRSTTGKIWDIMDNDIKFVYGDLWDVESLTKVFNEDKFDGIFHLAAQSHPPSSFVNPRLTFRINAEGTINICSCIEQIQPESVLMNCSTSEVYGICSADSKINETFHISPVSPYGVSKAAADLYVKERARNKFMKAFSTRAFSHTGPRRGNIFSIASDAYQIAKIIKKSHKRVIQVGNLTSQRVVIDVRDVVFAYYLLMMKALKTNEVGQGEAYNIGGDDLHDMQFFLDTMLAMFNLSDVTTEINPEFYRKIDIPVQRPDSVKIRKLTGWKPIIPIEKTLIDLVNYWVEKI